MRLEAKKKPLLGRMSVGEGEQGIQFHLPKAEADPFQQFVIKKQSDARGIEASKRTLEAGEHSIHLKLSSIWAN